MHLSVNCTRPKASCSHALATGTKKKPRRGIGRPGLPARSLTLRNVEGAPNAPLRAPSLTFGKATFGTLLTPVQARRLQGMGSGSLGELMPRSLVEEVAQQMFFLLYKVAEE